jgi:predicted nucleic acid-binding protein
MAFVVDTSVVIAWFINASFIELAQRLGLPLAAKDKVLLAAARRAGVPTA